VYGLLAGAPVAVTVHGLRRVEHVMGMPVSLHLADPLPVATLTRLADEVFAWLREVDARFSTYREHSEVNRFGRGELRWAACSADMRAVLDRCAALWHATDGYFDTYVTGRLDPSGYVKGWAVQVASDRLVEAGAVNHFLNAGGDLRVHGCPEPAGAGDRGAGWRIGIRHPWLSMRVCWVLEGTDIAVATSGTYERGPHVIDPRRGVSADDLSSVTVVGPDLGEADAYATAGLAMGTAGIDWLARLAGHESAIVTADGRCFRSDGLPVVSGLTARTPPGSTTDS
jgi:thiamine biosynthesis lipoprotein